MVVDSLKTFKSLNLEDLNSETSKYYLLLQ